MDENGLWKLFERTGLPEAYLALWAAREGELPAKEDAGPGTAPPSGADL